MANGATFTRQAAALPVRNRRVCLVTSSNGKRWVIPKGLIDLGHTAGETALKEAWEEAGLIGILQTEPLGSYLYEKYGGTYHVTVFLMQVTEAAPDWPEMDLRQRTWLGVNGALERIEDPGLADIIRVVLGRGVKDKVVVEV